MTRTAALFFSPALALIFSMSAAEAFAAPVLITFGEVQVGGQAVLLTNPMTVTDGGLVIGTSTLPGDLRVGLRWSPSFGLENLGFAITAVGSEDGRAVAISGRNSNQDPIYTLWRSQTGQQTLGISNASVVDITLDGSQILLGTGRIWSEATGEQPIDLPPGAMQFFTTGMSGDATSFIGSVSFDGMSSDQVLLQNGDVVVNFSALLGGNVQTRYISNDGSTVLGLRQSQSGAQARGFRFNRMMGWQYLPLPAGIDPDADMFLNAATSDGSKVLGIVEDSSGFHSMIWDAVNGSRNLRTELEAQGLDLSEWITLLAFTMSGNGRYLTGIGQRVISPGVTGNQGWLIDLDPPIAASCPGDADGNGSVNFTDIGNVLASFGVTCQ